MNKEKGWEKHLPPITEDVNEYWLNEFYRIMFERQEIWYKRFILKEKRPWTKDPILNKYKFCNIYRELDRSSQYLINNIWSKCNNIWDLVFQTMVFRVFNLPETFEAVKMPTFSEYDKIDFMAKIIHYAESTGKNPLNTKAYLINTYQWKGKSHENYCEHIIPGFHAITRELCRFDKYTKPEDWIKIITSVEGVGKFLSHEIYIDCCYFNRYIREGYFPWNENDYTNVGPGAERGLRLIFPSLAKKDHIKGMELLRDMASEYLKGHGNFKYLYWDVEKKKYYIGNIPNLTIHSGAEMLLCELFKYFRQTIKEGKQRAIFTPQLQPNLLSGIKLV